MALQAIRANIRAGPHSRALIIPAQLEIGPKSSIAANRLLLADIRGEIPPKDLLDFLESCVEPKFWAWYQKRKPTEEKKARIGLMRRVGKRRQTCGKAKLENKQD